MTWLFYSHTDYEKITECSLNCLKLAAVIHSKYQLIIYDM